MNNLLKVMEYEASIVCDWPIEIQNLIDQGLVHVIYDLDDCPIFSLTSKGKRLFNQIDLNLN